MDGSPHKTSPPEGKKFQMDRQEKSGSHESHTQVTSTQQQGNRPLRRVFFAVCLGLLLVSVAFSTPSRVWRGMHCGNAEAHQAPGARVESTPLTTLLHMYFPGRHQHGLSTAEPKATAVVRLARRQDNSTSSSSTPSSSSSSATSSATSSTTSRSTSSSSSVSNSSSPPRNDGSSTTTTSRTTSTTSTPSGNGTPPQTPGTTLTRSTTLPGGGQGPQGQTVTRSSKVVVETLTSTLPNGSIVVVTQTSVVSADPTESAGSANAPSLHSVASRQQGGITALLSIVGAVVGMILA